MQHIALFGGTFDPVHNGHLFTSINIQNHFKFDSYRFLLCKTPAIKPPAFASYQQRIQMLEMTIKKHPEFSLDLREINRDTPSYTVDTLSDFRAEFPNASISLIIGYDAFLSLPYWYKWEKIIQLANLLVINRNAFSQQPVPDLIQHFQKRYQSKNKSLFLAKHAGNLFLFDAGNYDISSTAIREKIRQKKEIRDELLPEIYEYIQSKRLYV